MTRAELQELIDATPDGGTVELPAGRHVIDGPLRVSGQYKTVSGLGGAMLHCLTDYCFTFTEDAYQCLATGFFITFENPETAAAISI